MRKFLIVLMMAVGVVAPMVVTPVWAAKCGDVDTNLISCGGEDKKGGPILEVLQTILNIVSGAVVTVATAGLVFSGVQYLTARDNDAQVAKAKNRIFQIVIGLIVYAVMGAFLAWLLPGFGGGS